MQSWLELLVLSLLTCHAVHTSVAVNEEVVVYSCNEGCSWYAVVHILVGFVM